MTQTGLQQRGREQVTSRVKMTAALSDGNDIQQKLWYRSVTINQLYSCSAKKQFAIYLTFCNLSSLCVDFCCLFIFRAAFNSYALKCTWLWCWYFELHLHSTLSFVFEKQCVYIILYTLCFIWQLSNLLCFQIPMILLAVYCICHLLLFFALYSFLKSIEMCFITVRYEPLIICTKCALFLAMARLHKTALELTKVLIIIETRWTCIWNCYP